MKFGILFFVVIFAFLGLGIFSMHQAYGHGIGGETLNPVTVGNRNATVFITIEPAVFEETGEKRMLVRFFDADTEQVIENVTYMIEATKGDQRLFRNMFFDELGFLILKINPTNSENVTISGGKESVLGGWTKNGTNSVTISGPIFNEGGLYKFKIEIITVDSVRNVLDERVTFDAGISVAQKKRYSVTGADGNNYDFGITSYYDTIRDFEYNPVEKNAIFSMSFDWSEENIKQTTIVHEEFHIPKTFGDLLVTRYDVTVNGIQLPKSSVVIDDYSDDDRIVHAIIPQETLMSIRPEASKISDKEIQFSFTASKEVQLPLRGQTTSLEYMVELWWEPSSISVEKETKFFVDLREVYKATKMESPITFDLILQKDNKEIFRKSVNSILNGPPKITPIEFVFLEEHMGPVKVIVENIDNKKFATKDFMVVVEPDEVKLQEFPIRLSSLLQNEDGTISEGKFNVDITWFSNPLKIDEESEFIITIYDKNTEIPVSGTSYDFVLLKNNEEILRTAGFAKVGGSFENFKFTNNDLGAITLRIENIANSGEFVEIPLSVTPEFPVGVFLVLGIMLSILIVFRKTSGYHGILQS